MQAGARRRRRPRQTPPAAGRSMDVMPRLALAEAAVSTAPLPERSQEMLRALRGLVPFDAAWLALADPMSSRYSSLAGTDLDDGVLEYLSGPETAHDIEATGTDRSRP